MSKEHLTYFKVENFKRFDSLELTDIGQFNLVVGDNNVGKTSLLEAISIVPPTNTFEGYNLAPEDSDFLSNLIFTVKRRGIEINPGRVLQYVAKVESLPIKIAFNKQQQISFEEGHLGSIKFSNGKASKEYHINSETTKNANPTIIPAAINPNGSLPELYQKTVAFSLLTKKLIINNLKIIDSHISEIEVLPVESRPHVVIGFDNSDKYIPITGMGESAVRTFYYLLNLIGHRNYFLLIDEIDTGIHYSRMKHFLKTIFQVAVKNEVQLFMTTHSLECQQAFAEVFEAPDMLQHQQNARQYTLIEKPDGQVTAIKRDWKQLEFALETDNETRGGKQVW